MHIIQRIALALVIIGAINWGLIGFFRFDLVATLFGGQDAFLSRIIYSLVGISGLACIPLLFAPIREAMQGINPQNQRYSTEFGEDTDFSDHNSKR